MKYIEINLSRVKVLWNLTQLCRSDK